MMNIALLFVFLGTAEFALSANKCGLDDYQYKLYTEVHKNMNLTLDCQAVADAKWGTQLMLNRGKDHVDTRYWCKYLAKTYATFYFGKEGTWIQDKLLKETNFDQVAQTALLHPQTKYGCYARRAFRDISFEGDEVEDYVLLCIYQKLAPQPLCNIDWSY